MFIKVKSPVTNTWTASSKEIEKKEPNSHFFAILGPHFLPLRFYVKSEEARQSFAGYGRPPQSHSCQERGKTLLETQIRQWILPSQNTKQNRNEPSFYHSHRTEFYLFNPMKNEENGTSSF